MGQRRKFVEFASIPLGTRVPFPAKLDSKDADIRKDVGNRQMSCSGLQSEDCPTFFAVVLSADDEKYHSAGSLDVKKAEEGSCFEDCSTA